MFHQRLSSAAPGFEARLNALEDGYEAKDAPTEHRLLRDLVVRDIASLQDLLDHVSEQDFQRTVRLMQQADTLYLIGQLRSAPVAAFLRYVLTMLGKRVVLLDPGGGLATHMARTMGARDLLIAISFRNDAKEVVLVAKEARAHGAPVLAITDTTLSPVAKTATVLFAVPKHAHNFLRSLAAPMCLAQALVVAIASRIQDNTAHAFPWRPRKTRADPV